MLLVEMLIVVICFLPKEKVAVSMDKKKQKRLEESGWLIEDVSDFLISSPTESTIVDLMTHLTIAIGYHHEMNNILRAIIDKIDALGLYELKEERDNLEKILLQDATTYDLNKE